MTNFSVGSILKRGDYLNYFDWEASRRLFKAFLAVLVFATFYYWFYIQVALASDAFIPH